MTDHQWNQQLLKLEIYKTRHDLNHSFMKQITDEKEFSYNLKYFDKLRLPKAKSTGLENRYS